MKKNALKETIEYSLLYKRYECCYSEKRSPPEGDLEDLSQAIKQLFKKLLIKKKICNGIETVEEQLRLVGYNQCLRDMERRIDNL